MLVFHGIPATPEDLSRLDTQALSTNDGRGAWVLIKPEGQEFTFHHQPRYVANDLQTLKLAVLAGTASVFYPKP